MVNFVTFGGVELRLVISMCSRPRMADYLGCFICVVYLTVLTVSSYYGIYFLDFSDPVDHVFAIGDWHSSLMA